MTNPFTSQSLAPSNLPVTMLACLLVAGCSLDFCEVFSNSDLATLGKSSIELHRSVMLLRSCDLNRKRGGKKVSGYISPAFLFLKYELKY